MTTKCLSPSAQDCPGDYAERLASEVVNRPSRLASQSGRPFFLWVHVFDPHSPYDPPSPFREKYSGRAYDGEVAYTDQELGRLFAAVDKKSPPADTLVAALSDHGESLSEHGEYTHGVFLYDSTLRIAFLMSGPGVPQGKRVKQQARAIDALPTLAGLMGGKCRLACRDQPHAGLAGKASPASDAIQNAYPRINTCWAELRGLSNAGSRSARPGQLYDLRRTRPGTNVISTPRAQQLEVNEGGGQ
jgi:arylsulfatase A-like enzyme